AKWQLTMLELLLRNDGERAKKIKAEFTPRFASKEEYFAYTESMSCSGNRIEYGDGAARVIL
ncbi:MAG: hypothetical protein IKV97_05955, partial [Clostridia bacterium]|nr:hypothetical protein [Clostridia bacterium]